MAVLLGLRAGLRALDKGAFAATTCTRTVGSGIHTPDFLHAMRTVDVGTAGRPARRRQRVGHDTPLRPLLLRLRHYDRLSDASARAHCGARVASIVFALHPTRGVHWTCLWGLDRVKWDGPSTSTATFLQRGNGVPC